MLTDEAYGHGMSNDLQQSQSLARCHGFLAVASDGPLGTVEQPLLPPDRNEPDFLVISVGRYVRRWPVVAVALVERVDPARRLVYLKGRAKRLARLPETLPLAI
jgi:hypothetical protein